MLPEQLKPTKLEDLVGPAKNIAANILKIGVTKAEHMLFYGSSGVGKGSVMTVLSHTWFKDGLRGRFMDMNASDDRGIDVVRDLVKQFAATQSPDGGRKCIYLDEADQLTGEAQDALRRIIEDYSGNCLFILACNHINKISKAIKDRCVEVKFDRLSPEDLADIAARVAKVTGNDVSEDDMTDIIMTSNGSARSVIKRLSAIDLYENKMPEGLLSKPVNELIEMGYKFDPRELLSRLFDEIILSKSALMKNIPLIRAFAEADAHMSFSYGVIQWVSFLTYFSEARKAAIAPKVTVG